MSICVKTTSSTCAAATSPPASSSCCAGLATSETNESKTMERAYARALIRTKIAEVTDRALDSIELSNCSLSRFPKKLAKSAGWLNEIVLSKNLFIEIPELLHKFPLLAHLDLSSNRISSVPAEFFSGSRLCSLNLSGNNISSFDLKDCDYLSFLNLADNPIEDISETLLLKNSLTIVLSPSDTTDKIKKFVLDRESIGLNAASILEEKKT